MATLTVQQLTNAGLVISLAAADVAGDEFTNLNDERTKLVVDNADASPINVTITAQETSRNAPGAGVLDIEDIVVAVAAGTQQEIGPFPSAYTNPSNGRVAVSYSAVTDITVGAVRMARASY